MIHEYGVVDGFGITHWGARTEEEAMRWMLVEHRDPKGNGVKIVKRVNN